jgi:hypothetical protein
MIVRLLLVTTFAIGASAFGEKANSQREDLNYNTYESSVLSSSVLEAFDKELIQKAIVAKARSQSGYCFESWSDRYRLQGNEAIYFKVTVQCYKKGAPNVFEGGQQIEFNGSMNKLGEISYKSIRFIPDVGDKRAGAESNQHFASCSERC